MVLKNGEKLLSRPLGLDQHPSSSFALDIWVESRKERVIVFPQHNLTDRLVLACTVPFRYMVQSATSFSRDQFLQSDTARLKCDELDDYMYILSNLCETFRTRDFQINSKPVLDFNHSFVDTMNGNDGYHLLVAYIDPDVKNEWDPQTARLERMRANEEFARLMNRSLIPKSRSDGQGGGGGGGGGGAGGAFAEWAGPDGAEGGGEAPAGVRGQNKFRTTPIPKPLWLPFHLRMTQPLQILRLAQLKNCVEYNKGYTHGTADFKSTNAAVNDLHPYSMYSLPFALDSLIGVAPRYSRISSYMTVSDGKTYYHNPCPEATYRIRSDDISMETYAKYRFPNLKRGVLIHMSDDMKILSQPTESTTPTDEELQASKHRRQLNHKLMLKHFQNSVNLPPPTATDAISTIFHNNLLHPDWVEEGKPNEFVVRPRTEQDQMESAVDCRAGGETGPVPGEEQRPEGMPDMEMVAEDGFDDGSGGGGNQSGQEGRPRGERSSPREDEEIDMTVDPVPSLTSNGSRTSPPTHASSPSTDSSEPGDPSMFEADSLLDLLSSVRHAIDPPPKTLEEDGTEESLHDHAMPSWTLHGLPPTLDYRIRLCDSIECIRHDKQVMAKLFPDLYSIPMEDEKIQKYFLLRGATGSYYEPKNDNDDDIDMQKRINDFARKLMEQEYQKLVAKGDKSETELQEARKKMWDQFYTAGFSRFHNNIFTTTCNASPYWHATVKWINEMCAETNGRLFSGYRINKITSDLSFLCDFVHSFLAEREALHEDSTCHKNSLKGWLVALSANDPNRKARIHWLAFGLQASSKSWLLECVKMSCVPVTEMFTMSTLRSDTVPGNFDGCMRLHDEMDYKSAGSGANGRPERSENERAFKLRMSMCVEHINDMYFDDQHNRCSRKSFRKCLETHMMNTNAPRRSMTPEFLDRCHAILFIDRDRAGRNVANLICAPKNRAKQQAQAEAYKRQQLIHAMIYTLDQMVTVGLLDEVKGSFARKAIPMVLRKARDIGLPRTGLPRAIQRMLTVVRVLTKLRAVLLTFFGPLSKVRDKVFSLNHFREVIGHMEDYDPNVFVLAFGLFQEYQDPVHQKILQTIVDKILDDDLLESTKEMMETLTSRLTTNRTTGTAADGGGKPGMTPQQLEEAKKYEVRVLAMQEQRRLDRERKEKEAAMGPVTGNAVPTAIPVANDEVEDVVEEKDEQEEGDEIGRAMAEATAPVSYSLEALYREGADTLAREEKEANEAAEEGDEDRHTAYHTEAVDEDSPEGEGEGEGEGETPGEVGETEQDYDDAAPLTMPDDVLDPEDYVPTYTLPVPRSRPSSSSSDDALVSELVPFMQRATLENGMPVGSAEQEQSPMETGGDPADDSDNSDEDQEALLVFQQRLSRSPVVAATATTATTATPTIPTAESSKSLSPEPGSADGKSSSDVTHEAISEHPRDKQKRERELLAKKLEQFYYTNIKTKHRDPNYVCLPTPKVSDEDGDQYKKRSYIGRLVGGKIHGAIRHDDIIDILKMLGDQQVPIRRNGYDANGRAIIDYIDALAYRDGCIVIATKLLLNSHQNALQDILHEVLHELNVLPATFLYDVKMDSDTPFLCDRISVLGGSDNCPDLWVPSADAIRACSGEHMKERDEIRQRSGLTLNPNAYPSILLSHIKNIQANSKNFPVDEMYTTDLASDIDVPWELQVYLEHLDAIAFTGKDVARHGIFPEHVIRKLLVQVAMAHHERDVLNRQLTAQENLGWTFQGQPVDVNKVPDGTVCERIDENGQVIQHKFFQPTKTVAALLHECGKPVPYAKIVEIVEHVVQQQNDLIDPRPTPVQDDLTKPPAKPQLAASVDKLSTRMKRLVQKLGIAADLSFAME